MKSKFSADLLRPILLGCLFLAFIALTASAKENDPPVDANTTTFAETVITKNDETGLIFDLNTPAAISYAQGNIVVRGLGDTIDTAGAPALPYFTTYVAVPPQASYEVEVNAVGLRQDQIEFVVPAPAHQLLAMQQPGNQQLSHFDVPVTEAAPSYEPDPVIYGENALYPPQNYGVSDEIVAGDLRLIKVNLYPLRYNPAEGTLRQTTTMAVSVRFEDAALAASRPDAVRHELDAIWRQRVLNYPAASWRLTSRDTRQESIAETSLPLGVETFKIEVDADGIYGISGSELAALGMDIASVDPPNIQMMHRGKTVAHLFQNNDGKPAFGPSDTILFHGWKFDGSRYEDLYVSDNVFWLWDGDNGEQIKTKSNKAGLGYTKVTAFNESLTTWPHRNFFEGWATDWDKAPNEPTAWYWDRIGSVQGGVGKRNEYFDLPNPATQAGATAKLLVEFTSRYSALINTQTTYNVKMYLNDSDISTEVSWDNGKNVNFVHEVDLSQLTQPDKGTHPQNKLSVELSGDTKDDTLVIYLVRVTADYLRELVAVDNQLVFSQSNAGNHEFHISGFSDAAKAIVWDISDRYTPVAIEMPSANIKSATAESTFIIGRNNQANAQFIATTTGNIKTVKSISKYVASDLTPPSKAGTWVAISHQTLLPSAQILADFRKDRSGISTWVVDIEDIVNQYGYGINTPEAIRAYLKDGLATWTQPPQYLVLFGDATINPRNLGCHVGCVGWDEDKPTLVPTDLLFVDRFNGLIPVDYTYSLLVGDDLFPDLSVGRITAEDNAAAYESVRKIMTYETSFDSIKAWHKNIVFVADNPDSGGQFCLESGKTAGHIPNSIRSTFLCLPSEDDNGLPPIEDSTESLRLDLFEQINDVGTVILNYRGHGGVTSWANPHIMHNDDAAVWQNVGRPPIVMSADCLDGHFAKTEKDGLGETIFGLNNKRGSSAHWSSSGLGFTFEHSVLHESFYEAVFKHDIDAIGDVINYAKVVYLTKGYDESEAYAFTLLGDPYMEVYPWQPTINLPIILKP